MPLVKVNLLKGARPRSTGLVDGGRMWTGNRWRNPVAIDAFSLLSQLVARALGG